MAIRSHHGGRHLAAVCSGKGVRLHLPLREGMQPALLQVESVGRHHARGARQRALRDQVGNGALGVLVAPVVDIGCGFSGSRGKRHAQHLWKVALQLDVFSNEEGIGRERFDGVPHVQRAHGVLAEQRQRLAGSSLLQQVQHLGQRTRREDHVSRLLIRQFAEERDGQGIIADNDRGAPARCTRHRRWLKAGRGG